MGGRDIERIEQEVVPHQARIPLAAVGIEDPEHRPTTRRTVAVVCDERFGALTDDISTETDPGPTRQLESDPGRLRDRGREASESGGIEDEEEALRPPCERGESMETLRDPSETIRPGQAATGQIEDEHVDGSTREQRSGDPESFVQAGGRDDDEPFETDAAGDGLDRVEAAGQVEPGHDRALGLRLGSHPQGEGRPAARAITSHADTRGPGEPARSEDRIERGEAGMEDPAGRRRGRGCLGSLRRRRQRHCPDDPRSCGTPASPEARDGGIHITTSARHRMPIVEHPFYPDKVRVAFARQIQRR